MLHKYELASGQKVNYNKSSIVFSKNVQSTFQTSVAESLSMEIVPVHEKYLGLPTYVGRSKIDTLLTLRRGLGRNWKDGKGKCLVEQAKRFW